MLKTTTWPYFYMALTYYQTLEEVPWHLGLIKLEKHVYFLMFLVQKHISLKKVIKSKHILQNSLPSSFNALSTWRTTERGWGPLMKLDARWAKTS